MKLVRWTRHEEYTLMTYGTGEFSGVTGDVKGGDEDDAGA